MESREFADCSRRRVREMCQTDASGSAPLELEVASDLLPRPAPNGGVRAWLRVFAYMLCSFVLLARESGFW